MTHSTRALIATLFVLALQGWSAAQDPAVVVVTTSKGDVPLRWWAMSATDILRMGEGRLAVERQNSHVGATAQYAAANTQFESRELITMRPTTATRASERGVTTLNRGALRKPLYGTGELHHGAHWPTCVLRV